MRSPLVMTTAVDLLSGGSALASGPEQLIDQVVGIGLNTASSLLSDIGATSTC